MSDLRASCYPGLWSQDEWKRGISLGDWAEWRAPETCAEVDANWVPVVSLDAPGEPEKEKRFWNAVRSLHDQLKTDLESKLIVLGIPPDSAFAEARPASSDALSEVIEEISFSPLAWGQAYFRNQRIEVRVYRPNRFMREKSDTGNDERDLAHTDGGGAAKAVGKGRPGRRKGAGSYEALDAPLVEKMHQLITEGMALSDHAAALKVVDRAAGGGTDESKARRLTDRYKRKYN